MSKERITTKEISDKVKNPYKVSGLSSSTKNVDPSKRLIEGVFNSYLRIDKDNDVLMPNCCAKSIGDRGPQSNASEKIKHLKNHNWNEAIAVIKELKEDTVIVDGREIQGLIHTSYYPESTDSNDMLIKVQSGVLDSRSIGFQYKKIQLAERDSENKERKALFDEVFPMVSNPEDLNNQGYFWVVKEVKLFEGSDVTFAANDLTPMIGVKSNDKASVLDYMFKKLDNMNSLFKSGNLTDNSFQKLEMETLQIKAYISTLIDSKSSIKDTILNNSRTNKDTKRKEMLLKRARAYGY